jgi:hypothetical protein
MGGKGWKKITKRHNKWARESNRLEWELKSLEAEYKLVRPHLLSFILLYLLDSTAVEDQETNGRCALPS